MQLKSGKNPDYDYLSFSGGTIPRAKISWGEGKWAPHVNRRGKTPDGQWGWDFFDASSKPSESAYIPKNVFLVFFF